MPNTQTIDRLKKIQKKLGLNDDGLIGPVTLSKLEAVVDEWLAFKKGQPKPDKVETPSAPSTAMFSMVVSKKSLDKLIEFEVTSEAAYEKKYVRPIWPGGESGVTIGIGYDLGFNNKTTIDRDWRGKIPDETVEVLKTASGVKGPDAKAKTAEIKSQVLVPFPSAKVVFYASTLPRYAADTRTVYPGVEKLPADAQGAILSLIYNRGSSLSGDRRKEMKAIVDLVAAKDLAGIAAQFTAMKRLWDQAALPGLHVRRDEEAKLIKNARVTYSPDELVKV